MDRAKVFKKWDKLVVEKKDAWMSDYILEIKNGNYLDIDFMDYQGFRLFLETEKGTIEEVIIDFKSKSGGDVNFNDAGWGLYLLATDRTNDLQTQLSEYAEA